MSAYASRDSSSNKAGGDNLSGVASEWLHIFIRLEALRPRELRRRCILLQGDASDVWCQCMRCSSSLGLVSSAMQTAGILGLVGAAKAAEHSFKRSGSAAGQGPVSVGDIQP